MTSGASCPGGTSPSTAAAASVRCVACRAAAGRETGPQCAIAPHRPVLFMLCARSTFSSRFVSQIYQNRRPVCKPRYATRASVGPWKMPPEAEDQVAPPPWFADLRSQPGIADDSKAQYWEDEDQVHGEDTIMKFLHTSKDIHGHVGPAVLGARVLVNRETKTIYGIWPLGRFVCGHKGICHGGMTSLAIDEMSGQAYVHFFQRKRGPGFTANLTVNYKAPIPSLTCVLLTVTVESVEGRKIWFATKMTDGPDGVVYAEARTLFIVARKDDVVDS